ncbi:MAG: hypothetical protein ACRC7O_17255 [Fimbriiglobus sp.]
MSPTAVHPKLARQSAAGAYGGLAPTAKTSGPSGPGAASGTVAEPRFKLADVYRGITAPGPQPSESGASDS